MTIPLELLSLVPQTIPYLHTTYDSDLNSFNNNLNGYYMQIQVSKKAPFQGALMTIKIYY